MKYFLKKYKSRAMYLCDSVRCNRITRDGVFKTVREGNEVEPMGFNDLGGVYLTAIEKQELKSGDTDLLNRVIRYGGFSSYIEFLNEEAKLQSI